MLGKRMPFFYLVGLWMSLLFLPCSTCAQTVELAGSIKDESGQPVELANVILLKLPDSTETSVAMTDSSGWYRFEQVKGGAYTLAVLQVGYDRFVSPAIQVGNESLTELNYTIQSEYKGSEEVTVTGQRSLIRQEADKMVVNVENMLGSAGLSTLDVLKRSPGVSVDNNGVITLKGKTGVLVMLDDKPLYMTAEQAGNLLKAIPSDQIKEVELITTPSAKYDAAGNAGIINIRLKKGAYEGFNGTANVSYGQGIYHKFSTGVNASYKKKKISASGGYQYNNRYDLEDDDINRKYLDPSSEYSRLYSYTYYRAPRENHTVTLNGQYHFTDRTSVSLDFIGAYAEYGWDGTGYSALYKKDNSINNSYTTTDYGVYSEGNFNNNLGFQHQLDTNGTKLSGSINYNRYTGVSNKYFEIQNYNALNENDGNPFLYRFRDPSYNNQYSAKVDIEGKLRKKIKYESGLKVLLTDKSNPASIAITQSNVTTDASNPFDYKEGIYAGYSTFKGDLSKKWKAQAGLRMEHTEINAKQTALDTSFTRSYTNLFPSANLTYQATEKTSYTILYSRRIQRPTPWQMNPVVGITDPYTSWGGNAYLQPEYTDNVELNQSLFSGYLVTTINYSYTVQPIAWVVINDTATLNTFTQPRNLQQKENAGVSMALNMPITKWWTTSCYVYVYQNRFVGDQGFGRTDRRQDGWNANTTQTFTLSKKTSAEISGFYQSGTLYGLSTVAPRGQLNLAMQRKIMASKAIVKLAVNDVFWTNNWYTTNTLGGIETKTNGRWDNRTVMLSFSYKFGNVVNRL